MAQELDEFTRKFFHKNAERELAFDSVRVPLMRGEIAGAKRALTRLKPEHDLGNLGDLAERFFQFGEISTALGLAQFQEPSSYHTELSYKFYLFNDILRLERPDLVERLIRESNNPPLAAIGHLDLAEFYANRGEKTLARAYARLLVPNPNGFGEHRTVLRLAEADLLEDARRYAANLAIPERKSDHDLCEHTRMAAMIRDEALLSKLRTIHAQAGRAALDHFHEVAAEKMFDLKRFDEAAAQLSQIQSAETRRDLQQRLDKKMSELAPSAAESAKAQTYSRARISAATDGELNDIVNALPPGRHRLSAMLAILHWRVDRKLAAKLPAN